MMAHKVIRGLCKVNCDQWLKLSANNAVRGTRSAEDRLRLVKGEVLYSPHCGKVEWPALEAQGCQNHGSVQK